MSPVRLFRPPAKRPARPWNRFARLWLEELESRLVPSAVSGNAWTHPELIKISFVPDGTNLNGYTSNLVATFNKKFGSAATWQNIILKAAQTWAQQTNINFALVSDSGAAMGSGSYQQGDSTFGDIRIGGYNFGSSTLAQAYMPPPVNNYSIAGDVQFNTGQTFNNGSAYDLFTVAAHEIGHALGLDHSTTSTAEMYSSYNGVKSALTSDDIGGIQSIYSGARSQDSYDKTASNGTSAAASDITSTINTTSKTALVNNLDITTTSDVDYYKFTAPTGSSSSLKVTVQSSGLSQLAPVVYVYNSSQKQLATATGLNKYGTTITATATGIAAGQVYYVKVAGADTTAFGTGKYSLILNMGTGTSPTATLPNTQTANGNPLSGGGGQALLEVPGTLINTTTSSADNPGETSDTFDAGPTGSSAASQHVTASFTAPAIPATSRLAAAQGMGSGFLANLLLGLTPPGEAGHSSLASSCGTGLFPSTGEGLVPNARQSAFHVPSFAATKGNLLLATDWSSSPAQETTDAFFAGLAGHAGERLTQHLAGTPD